VDATRELPFGPVFDRILVDAPCSGTGTLGRNPEIRWRIQPEELLQYAERQRAILRNALACLKPGGLLVYATCSLEQEENEEVVQAVAPERVCETSLRIPGVVPGDGFFAALLG
jgi:16S rRNA (cytosine967-C5)-methyltransferase